MKYAGVSTYEIRVRGHLSPRYRAWFGLELRHDFVQNEAVTIMTGYLPDQAALHGVLDKVQAFGLDLLELRKIVLES